MRISERGQITISEGSMGLVSASGAGEVKTPPASGGPLIRRGAATRHPVDKISGILDDLGDVDQYIEEIRGR